MNLNKLARWASVTAFSTIIPAAAMAKAHHSGLTHPTTAPSSLMSKHVKATPAKKTVANKLNSKLTHKPISKLTSKLKSRGNKAQIKGSKSLKTIKQKSVALKSKKGTANKLVARKSTVSKLTAKKHTATRLTTTRAKAHMLTSHKLTAKRAVKPATPVTPTM